MSLRDGQQINDEVINGMLEYQMRDRLDCHLFNTHFMTRYLRLRGTAENRHRQVAGWTARQRINLANKTAILVPVQFKASTPGGDHWFLLVATDMSGSHPSVTILNSIPGYGNDCRAARALIEYLRIECGGQMSVDSIIRLYQPLLPVQSTNNDCGAFVVLYHRHLLQDIDEFKVPHYINL